jgi:hypothetical protein
LQIRQSGGGTAITAIGGSNQREQGGVLCNRQELPIAKRPAPGSEITGKNFDFSYKWI